MLELERLSRILNGKGFTVGAKIIRGMSQTLYDGGLIPETVEFPPSYKAREFFEEKMAELLRNGEISKRSYIETRVRVTNQPYPENSLLILALPMRIVNALLRSRVKTLSELRGLLDRDLTMQIRNIGPSHEVVIRKRISEFDSFLLGENPLEK